MSEDDHFEILYKYLKERKQKKQRTCEHKVVSGVCEICYVVVPEFINDEGFHGRTTYRSENRQNKLNHFRNFLLDVEWLEGDDWHIALCDFGSFLKAYKSLEKKRKNSLLNKWVLWQLLEMRGVKVEKYHIKSKSSDAEHRKLGQKVFDVLGWGEIK